MTATAPEQLAHLSARLLHEFSDLSLLTLALTHRSYIAENDNSESNERLELLGDSVVGLAVTDHLFRTLTDRDEGTLAKIRSAVVSEPALAEVAEAIGLGDALRLGRSELLSGGRAKPSLLADAFEAVIAALYIDAGYDAAARTVVQLLDAQIRAATVGPGVHDYKTRLQELTMQRFEHAPVYDVAESGPGHAKRFHATVTIDQRALGKGEGTSKKRAEQAAAQAAWDALTGGENGAGVTRS
ncbi:MAG: ribonuclease III [Acidimicrobiales bacterium]